MTKEESLLARRFMDLSRQASQKGIVVFSEFLNINELNIFRQGISELYSKYESSGGYKLSERQMIAFIPDALCYTWNYPIACLEITPVNRRFARYRGFESYQNSRSLKGRGCAGKFDELGN